MRKQSDEILKFLVKPKFGLANNFYFRHDRQVVLGIVDKSQENR